MRVKCEYCGSYIDDSEAVCPRCGAPNEHMQRSGRGVPKTIEELKAFCAARSLPLEKMRFFIGQDYRGARAFGIYEDEDGRFVVYKNKSDGSRAVRYRGSDEAYAVSEIYQKLKSEVANQRAYQANKNARRSAPGRSVNSPYRRTESGYQKRVRRERRRSALGGILFVIALIVLIVVLSRTSILGDRPSTGYYHYNGSYYYNQSGSWYAYDDDSGYGGSWLPVTVDDYLEEHYDDYYESCSYDYDYGIDDFSDSDYYTGSSGGYGSYGNDSGYSSWNDDDWDDDDDWDWGGSDWDDWDSGSTDWDSDW